MVEGMKIPNPGRESGGPSPPGTFPRSLRALIVDDQPLNQRVARRMLERLGCRVDVVDDGTAALAACAATRFDFILMDCQMPEMDGFQTTRELRRRERGQTYTPVLAVTALGQPGDEDRCLEAGMDGYLMKPITLESLRVAIEPWIDR